MITVLKHTLTIKQILTSKGTWYKSYEKHKALIRKHNILRQKIILMAIYQNTPKNDTKNYTNNETTHDIKKAAKLMPKNNPRYPPHK